MFLSQHDRPRDNIVAEVCQQSSNLFRGYVDVYDVYGNICGTIWPWPISKVESKVAIIVVVIIIIILIILIILILIILILIIIISVFTCSNVVFIFLHPSSRNHTPSTDPVQTAAKTAISGRMARNSSWSLSMTSRPLLADPSRQMGIRSDHPSSAGLFGWGTKCFSVHTVHLQYCLKKPPISP